MAVGNDEVPEESFFELRFSPSFALVSTVRRFVSEFYIEVTGDRDLAHNLAMATHELLENALRYSSDGRSELWIALRRSGAQVHSTIQTKNRANADRIGLVRKALDEVIEASDPNELYNRLVRRAAKRRDGGSGLGLGRIRAEADLSIEYTILDDTLTLTAQGAFRPQPQQGLLQEAR